ncbi:MAG: hypothetical protein ABI481_01145 [Pyrinomonadaceae bacterium]
MVNKEIAITIQKRALSAIVELNTILSDVNGECSDEAFGLIKRGVGLSIGRIQMEILEPLYRQFPEIDDLAD